MNRKKKVLSILVSALIFSVAGSGQAQAAEIALNGNTDWVIGEWTGAGNQQSIDNYRINSGLMQIEITDYQWYGDAFTIYNNGQIIGTTNIVGAVVADVLTPADGWADPGMSKGTFVTGPGLLTVFASTNPWDGGRFGIRFTNYVIRTGNALRLDEAGTTTEKSNVVSCTPGKYTFLNGGSTAETAKIQSYVYTLLVNGKAVSTLSSDNFRSVASHLFPTIAGNMAGTATLEGATWDLKGMSNYSAACQVYATQSGGNIQSVTTAAHDAVALAAAAEAAAKVQATKNMIADWAASNDELAKKLRDRRLAGKP
jgi:hypothetical protein